MQKNRRLTGIIFLSIFILFGLELSAQDYGASPGAIGLFEVVISRYHTNGVEYSKEIEYGVFTTFIDGSARLDIYFNEQEIESWYFTEPIVRPNGSLFYSESFVADSYGFYEGYWANFVDLREIGGRFVIGQTGSNDTYAEIYIE